MPALRRDDGAAAAGISPAGKDRVGPGRSGQPAGRGAGCGYPVLFRLREAGIFPGRVEWSELEDPEGSGIARMECPSCGRSYELDSPKCPFCGKKNTRLF